MAGILKLEYKLFAILSALFVMTSILNSESGDYVTFFINLSTTLTEDV